ncbi:ATP-dependent DNA helicase DDM1 [Glycine soja]|nr:ATP-dependent DNA helicase DDM1 [Glycine max]
MGLSFRNDLTQCFRDESKSTNTYAHHTGFEMEAKDKVKNEDSAAESPTSVLEDEDVCALKEEVKLEEMVTADVKDDGSSLISKTMVEEEEKLLEARIKEEEVQYEEAVDLNDIQFNKLDELLTQTRLYSEFLLEKMDDITLAVGEQENREEQESNPSAKKGRGSKRKVASQYNTRKAKKAVAAMLTRSKESEKTEDTNMTEEERVEKEQKELMPLLTGGKLKNYQLKGVKWLISLWQNGLNGILADQMGLGKTIQTIGFLSHLKAKGLDGPYMIIAPLSTLSNWVNEISRFAPSLPAVIYHGDKKQRDDIRRKHMPTRTIGPQFPIVITSYEIALNDAKKYFRSYNWKYLVVDEGHRLKNSQCKLVKALKFINVENKLLLTGTPLQNNLAELWSLLNFILPDIFASLEEFESWFNLSGKSNNGATKEELEEKRRSQVVAKLHAILRPFLLRRMKSDVEIMLPRKKEIIIYANMTEHQKNLQDHLVNKTLGNYLKENMSSGRSVPAGMIRNLAIQLRKVCNHPDLLESAFDDSYLYPPLEEIVGQCGKFHLLDRLLQRLFARNHKVLIFSQWTKVLDIMDYYFSEKGFEVCRIDGGVKLDERKQQIQDFNDVNSNCRVFLLSTRAGGLGINLTAADTCILYDSDWNPQMDLQAMDRCHRIGQTKPVHVYRLSTAQSIEGRMLKRAFSKLKLEHVVIEKGQFHQERTKPASMDEIEEDDVLALLRDEETAEDKMIHTDISDEDLEKLLDRSDLIVNDFNDDNFKAPVSVFPLKGPGWEVVIPTATGGMLSTLNS